MDPEQEKQIRSQLGLTEELKLSPAELQLSEKINVRQKETAVYSFYVFLADTGGTLGVFLGLSLLQILNWCGTFYICLEKLRLQTFKKIYYVKRVFIIGISTDYQCMSIVAEYKMSFNIDRM